MSHTVRVMAAAALVIAAVTWAGGQPAAQYGPDVRTTQFTGLAALLPPAYCTKIEESLAEAQQEAARTRLVEQIKKDLAKKSATAGGALTDVGTCPVTGGIAVQYTSAAQVSGHIVAMVRAVTGPLPPGQVTRLRAEAVQRPHWLKAVFSPTYVILRNEGTQDAPFWVVEIGVTNPPTVGKGASITPAK